MVSDACAAGFLILSWDARGLAALRNVGLSYLDGVIPATTQGASGNGGHRMATTYKPGDTVPTTGTVKCTQYNGTQDRVTAGTTFAPCDHYGDHHPTGCTWQYL